MGAVEAKKEKAAIKKEIIAAEPPALQIAQAQATQAVAMKKAGGVESTSQMAPNGMNIHVHIHGLNGGSTAAPAAAAPAVVQNVVPTAAKAAAAKSIAADQAKTAEAAKLEAVKQEGKAAKKLTTANSPVDKAIATKELAIAKAESKSEDNKIKVAEKN